MDARLLNRTVLVAEDNWMLRESLVDALGAAGCRVLETSSGKAAVALLAQDRPLDLLLTDITLEDAITGWDLAEFARSRRPDLPVVYTSALSHDPARQVAGSCFLSKPFSFADLVAACAAMFGPG